MLGRVSLANKCLLLFGAAVVLIIVAALAVPWTRMNAMVDDSETEVSRQVVAAWESAAYKTAERAATSTEGGGGAGGVKVPSDTGTTPRVADAPMNALVTAQKILGEETGPRLISPVQVAMLRGNSRFIGEAWDALSGDAKRHEFAEASWQFMSRDYRYAKAVRAADGTLHGMMVLTRASATAAQSMLVNTVYLLSAGCVALGLAVFVFYLITNKLILGPVRTLKETAEHVRGGDLSTRSEIKTGDEFEELAETFNAMLVAIQDGQNQLRAVNASLDGRLSELAERNVALYEAAKLKGEFLANVSHELRTPLNSILGFADLLEESAKRDGETAGYDATRLTKRRRYIENIVMSGRALLDLINGLLEMAKVEAGKMELNIQPMNLTEACEHLVALMKPLADGRGVELRLEAPAELPMVHTDTRKFQQIVFNLMSNAIKFTADEAEHARSVAEQAAAANAEGNGEAPAPAAADAGANAPGVRPALVILRVEHLIPRGAVEGPDAKDHVRISVLDTGPGIAPEHQGRIFEKFVQLDTGHARKHTGTGLGLAMVKELTALLQGEVQVQSELGRGSMFSVILPTRLDPVHTAETKLEMSFRGALAGQKTGT